MSVRASLTALLPIPVLIFYLIFAEAFQKGIIAGAVKG